MGPTLLPANASASCGGRSSQRIVADTIHVAVTQAIGFDSERVTDGLKRERLASRAVGEPSEPMVFMSDRCAEQREDAFDAAPR